MNLEQNFFTLLGQPQQYAIDKALLKKRFRVLQRAYHPDRFVAKTPQEQRLAVQFSAHLNTAFSVLNDPVKRASHMLELANIHLDHQTTTIKDTAFLMQQMDIRESIADARAESDLTALQKLLATISDRYESCQQQFVELFSPVLESNEVVVDGIENKVAGLDAVASQDKVALQDAVGKMQFYQKLLDELNSVISSLSS